MLFFVKPGCAPAACCALDAQRVQTFFLPFSIEKLRSHSPQVPRQVLLDLLLCRGAAPGAQQRVHTHDKAGRAEAALRAVRLGQPLLDRVQPIPRVANAWGERKPMSR